VPAFPNSHDIQIKLQNIPAQPMSINPFDDNAKKFLRSPTICQVYHPNHISKPETKQSTKSMYIVAN
jgi:hypothetical protein